jgi:regulator of protease activity HflC (stomatin/prohibitin superfamily)
MVSVAGYGSALQSLRSSLIRKMIRIAVILVALLVFYQSCTTRVLPNQYGVKQARFGLKTGIVEKTYDPGLYFVGPGTTMHTFTREIQVLEASFEEAEARRKAGSGGAGRVEAYFEKRNKTLGDTTHRVIDAINVQTSDGYAVIADVTLLYSITDPVKIAKDFGWGTLYVDSFVINTFRNSVLGTLGKMNAESFYDGKARIKAIAEAQGLLTQRFAERGFKVETLLLRNFVYADNYERSLKDKKVAVQLTEKNRKESLVNEERAKLQQIESKGNGTITIAASEVGAKIAKIKAEAELYSSRTKAKADKEVNIAGAEAKRLKADALTQAGGRYVVALETAKMFDNIEGAVMTPEQYVAFVRNAWSLIGVSGGRDLGETGGKK